MNLKSAMLDVLISASVMEFLTSVYGEITELGNGLSYFLVLSDGGAHSVAKKLSELGSTVTLLI